MVYRVLVVVFCHFYSMLFALLILYKCVWIPSRSEPRAVAFIPIEYLLFVQHSLAAVFSFHRRHSARDWIDARGKKQNAKINYTEIWIECTIIIFCIRMIRCHVLISRCDSISASATPMHHRRRQSIQSNHV